MAPILTFNLLSRLKERQGKRKLEDIILHVPKVPRTLSKAQRLECRDAQGLSILKCPGVRHLEGKGILHCGDESTPGSTPLE